MSHMGVVIPYSWKLNTFQFLIKWYIGNQKFFLVVEPLREGGIETLNHYRKKHFASPKWKQLTKNTKQYEP